VTPLTAVAKARNVAPVDERTEERLALCLSGGGFRAAFYALGALRYLAEARRLEHVDVVSAVSGGSIAAGMLADRWSRFVEAGGTLQAFLDEVDAPFRTTVTTKNLRNEWASGAAGGFLRRRPGGRGAALGETLEEHLFEHRRVVDLPSRPQVIFTSTDLVMGRAFRISHDFVGSYDYDYVQPAPPALRLGVAVASSAAFPMSLTVVTLRGADLGLPKAPAELSLHDGGVYDNLGLEWFQRWDSRRRPKGALNPGFKIIVNASGALDRTPRKYGALEALSRDMSVQYAQTVNLRVSWQIDRLLHPPAGSSERGVYIGVGRDPRTSVDAEEKPVDPSFYAGALPSSFVEPLALLRTDLDRFLPEEADLLSYHAYWSLHARLKTFAPELALETPAWTKYAKLSESEHEQRKLLDLLAGGKKRKLLRRKIWRWTI
jgi:NTE family protein